jgi:hypothetical protein
MRQKIDITAALVEIIDLLSAIEAISPNRFLRTLEDIKCPRKIFEFTLELEYAANSKELRDTSDGNVHDLLNRISLRIEKFKSFFILNLYPSSIEQSEGWKKVIGQDSYAKRAFREDGSIRLGLLDSSLKEKVLHIQRIWDGGSYYGSYTNFKIIVDPAQGDDFQYRFALLHSFHAYR